MEEIKGLKKFSIEEQTIIMKALCYATEKHDGVLRASGDAYITHPIAVANILVEIGADAEAVCAGLLHDTIEDTTATKEEITVLFGWKIANIVDGVTKIKQISGSVSVESKEKMNLATIRKILVYAIGDMRIVLVKLADRLHNMRTLENMPREKQKSIAQQTLDVYVPIAEKIGAFRIKKELEDLAVKFLDPEYYETLTKEVTALLNDEYMIPAQTVQKEFSQKLQNEGIESKVLIRPKNIGGIYRCLKKNPLIDKIDDLLSIKILLNHEMECYTALGIVNLSYPVNSKIADYISNPKPNGYQSLHTRIFLPHQKSVVTPKTAVVKIRTFAQDKTATYGLTKDKYTKQQLFRVVECLNKDQINDEEFWQNMQREMSEEKIYVYGANGKIFELTKGATVIDFAYALHTKIGDTIKKVNVNGLEVPLDYELKDFDQVVVFPDKLRLGPDPSWLLMAKTDYAQRNIKRSLKKI